MDHLAAMVLRVERGRLPVPCRHVAARTDQWTEVLVVEVEGGQGFCAVDETRRAHRRSERIERVRPGDRRLQQSGRRCGTVVPEFGRENLPEQVDAVSQAILTAREKAGALGILQDVLVGVERAEVLRAGGRGEAGGPQPDPWGPPGNGSETRGEAPPAAPPPKSPG